jgi:hypothetical protein
LLDDFRVRESGHTDQKFQSKQVHPGVDSAFAHRATIIEPGVPESR